MNQYLIYASSVYRNVVKNPGYYNKLRVIIGNESCDLDSVICSLVYGYILFEEEKNDQNNAESVGTLSLLNIPHGDLPFKTEVTYYLKENKINLEHLQTRGSRDFLSLKAIYDAGALELILVDHHTLPLIDEDLKSSVIEIIDHRQRDETFLWEGVKDIDIRLVGSCSSIVAEKIIKRCPHLLTVEIAKLLLGPIIIDTVNLCPDAGRATELDHEMVRTLENQVTIDRIGLLAQLVRAKSNIESLSTQQVLRKDLKIIGGIPVSGSPVLIESLCKRVNFKEDIISFMRLRNEIPVVVLLGLHVNGANVARDLAICSYNEKISNLILNAFMELKEPELQLREVKGHGIDIMRLFRQNNVKATRKHLGPVIKKATIGVNEIISCALN